MPVPGNETRLASVALETAKHDANAIRWYMIHVAGEEFALYGDPDNPAVKIIEEIYKSATVA